MRTKFAVCSIILIVIGVTVADPKPDPEPEPKPEPKPEPHPEPKAEPGAHFYPQPTIVNQEYENKHNEEVQMILADLKSFYSQIKSEMTTPAAAKPDYTTKGTKHPSYSSKHMLQISSKYVNGIPKKYTYESPKLSTTTTPTSPPTTVKDADLDPANEPLVLAPATTEKSIDKTEKPTYFVPIQFHTQGHYDKELIDAISYKPMAFNYPQSIPHQPQYTPRFQPYYQPQFKPETSYMNTPPPPQSHYTYKYTQENKVTYPTHAPQQPSKIRSKIVYQEPHMMSLPELRQQAQEYYEESQMPKYQQSYAQPDQKYDQQIEVEYEIQPQTRVIGHLSGSHQVVSGYDHEKPEEPVTYSEPPQEYQPEVEQEAERRPMYHVRDSQYEADSKKQNDAIYAEVNKIIGEQMSDYNKDLSHNPIVYDKSIPHKSYPAQDMQYDNVEGYADGARVEIVDPYQKQSPSDKILYGTDATFKLHENESNYYIEPLTT